VSVSVAVSVAVARKFQASQHRATISSQVLNTSGH
jgi:hypothetical protein